MSYNQTNVAGMVRKGLEVELCRIYRVLQGIFEKHGFSGRQAMGLAEDVYLQELQRWVRYISK